MAVVDLLAAKAFLNIENDTSDGVLQGFIDSAQASIEELVGPLEPTPKTVRVYGCRPTLLLPITPVLDLVSVTGAGGTVLDVNSVYLDKDAGTIERNLGGDHFHERYYTVVYSAGRITCPADLVMAVKELLRHNWNGSQRGPKTSGANSTETANSVPGAATMFPFSVEQRIAAHIQFGIS